MNRLNDQAFARRAPFDRSYHARFDTSIDDELDRLDEITPRGVLCAVLAATLLIAGVVAWLL